MKISEQELREMVREVIQQKVGDLKEAKDFSARRQVVHSAQKASMDFEQEIINLLGLIHPDDLPAQLQKKYYGIVNDMQKKVVSAVMEATKNLTGFPKKDSGQGK